MNKLLICTQTMDTQSSTLGFFVRWVTKLAPFYDQITVICLSAGEYTLPANVRVLSLGKEHYSPTTLYGRFSKYAVRLAYICRFYYYILKEWRQYNKVFIHMNDEYGILGGLLWKLLRKKIFLWRNHYSGHFYTRYVGLFCTHVFYTSKFSFTANKKLFPNGIQMPVGVDIESLETTETFDVPPHSILSLARLDPSKKPELILQALAHLKAQNQNFSMSFVGGTSHDKWPNYEVSVHELKDKLGLGDTVRFVGAVPSTETYKYYLSHEIYINVAQSGMLDKTIFKALAAGCVPVTTSIDFNEMIEPLVHDNLLVASDDHLSLAAKLTWVMNLTDSERVEMVNKMQQMVINKHSLQTLAKKISELV